MSCMHPYGSQGSGIIGDSSFRFKDGQFKLSLPYSSRNFSFVDQFFSAACAQHTEKNCPLPLIVPLIAYLTRRCQLGQFFLETPSSTVVSSCWNGSLARGPAKVHLRLHVKSEQLVSIYCRRLWTGEKQQLVTKVRSVVVFSHYGRRRFSEMFRRGFLWSLLEIIIKRAEINL